MSGNHDELTKRYYSLSSNNEWTLIILNVDYLSIQPDFVHYGWGCSILGFLLSLSLSFVNIIEKLSVSNRVN